MGSLDWSTKDLDAIETELALIDQHRCLVKSPPPLSSAAISVSECIQPTPTPPRNLPQIRRSPSPASSSGSVLKCSWKIIIASYVVTDTPIRATAAPYLRQDTYLLKINKGCPRNWTSSPLADKDQYLYNPKPNK